jgi:hypothetical protein
MEVIRMADGQIAWVTHAPADYMLVFTEDPDGKHAVVGARFDDEGDLREAGQGLEGAEVAGRKLHVYCTLPGEGDRVLVRLREAGSVETWVDRGAMAFVAVGDGSGTKRDTVDNRREVTARAVLSRGGDAPRCYLIEGHCAACGEFRGRIAVLPQGAMMIDTRRLACRCESIRCRYCDGGKVRRPLSEHFDPERRAGCVPWFGYLVPCGSCQAAGRGPRVQMSA